MHTHTYIYICVVTTPRNQPPCILRAKQQGFVHLRPSPDFALFIEEVDSDGERRIHMGCSLHPATVSRPSRAKVRTLPRKTADVQKRAPLPPEHSRVRPCHGFAPLEAKSEDPSPVPLGVRWRWVCVGWCELVTAWSASWLVLFGWCCLVCGGGGQVAAAGGRRRRRRRPTAGVQPKNKNPTQ